MELAFCVEPSYLCSVSTHPLPCPMAKTIDFVGTTKICGVQWQGKSFANKLVFNPFNLRYENLIIYDLITL